MRVEQNPPFAANAFGDEDAANARRPYHACWVELNELHVHQCGPRVIGERVAVARIFPAIAIDLERAAYAARCDHDGICLKETKSPSLALVSERARDAVAVF